MQEQYRPIDGFPEYEISNLGNVKSVKGSKDNLLKQEVIKRDHTNYRRVTLSKNGITYRFQVHRLVAQSFIENIDRKPLVNHIDNNGENNRFDNLEWCTHSENMIHAEKQGRLFSAQSAGGTIAGQISKAKADENEQSLYGKQFGNWLILGQATDNTSDRRKVSCKCLLCNNIYDVSTGSITSGSTTNCLSCGKSKNTIARRTIEAEAYLDLELDNWKVVDFEIVRSYTGKNRITTFLKCDCQRCINTTVMNLDYVKKSVFNQCIICKTKLKG